MLTAPTYKTVAKTTQTFKLTTMLFKTSGAPSQKSSSQLERLLLRSSEHTQQVARTALWLKRRQLQHTLTHGSKGTSFQPLLDFVRIPSASDYNCLTFCAFYLCVLLVLKQK